MQTCRYNEGKGKLLDIPQSSKKFGRIAQNFIAFLLVFQIALSQNASQRLTTAVYGGTFGDNFLSSFQSGVINLAQADLQTLIGDRYNGANAMVNGGEGSLGHVIEHAMVGCLAGAALGGSCEAGAMAAAASALYAGAVDPEQAQRDQSQFVANATLLGGLVAAVASGGDTNATMIASGVAGSAFANNYLTHAEAEQRARLQEQIAECGNSSTQCSSSDLAALHSEVARLDALDRLRDDYLLGVCGAGMVNECVAARADLVAAQNTYFAAAQGFGSDVQAYIASVGGPEIAQKLALDNARFEKLLFESERLGMNAVSLPWDPAAFGVGLAGGFTIGASIAAAPALIQCLSNAICATELAASVGDDLAMTGGALSATVVGGKTVIRATETVVGEIENGVLLIPLNISQADLVSIKSIQPGMSGTVTINGTSTLITKGGDGRIVDATPIGELTKITGVPNNPSPSPPSDPWWAKLIKQLEGALSDD